MVEPNIIEYLNNSLAAGRTKEELYKELLNQGWTIEVIQENFDAINADKNKEDTSKKTIRVVLTIGAVLIGAGIFSFIASNWQEMPKAIKIGVILVAMLSSYTFGWTLKVKYQMEKTAGAMFLLGSIIYGSGIFLVSQIFNMRINWPDGFILWMIGSVALAFALESYMHYYLAIVLGIIAAVGHPMEIFTGIFGYRFFLMTSSFLLLVVTVVAFLTGWSIHRKIPKEFENFY